jgi:hypothetical protein
MQEAESKVRSYRFLDGTTLKLLAMISMIFDHVGDNFFPGQTWMRIIGRIAMPVFAFCLAEGFAHTRDSGKYLMRMGLFALISEVPFDLVVTGKVLEFSHQNIMFTFFLALMGLSCFEKLTEKKTRAGTAAGGFLLLAFTVLSLLLGLDYNMLGTGLVFVFYLLRNKAHALRCLAGAVCHVLLRNMGIYWFGLLGFLPILCYNGKKGRGLKQLFYVFYPAHLLIIYLVRIFLLKH